MKSRSAVWVLVVMGVLAAIVFGAAIWLNRVWKVEVAHQGARQPVDGVAPAPVEKAPEPEKSQTRPAGEPVAASALAAPPAGVDRTERPKARRVQDRAVPLAKLPAEIYQPARGGVVGEAPGATRRPIGVQATGAKVDDPLAAARERLAKDARLREWFDQWQVDQAAERATSPARLAELRSLLEKTGLGAEDLRAVAEAVVKAEGETSDVARAWRGAAAKGR